MSIPKFGVGGAGGGGGVEIFVEIDATPLRASIKTLERKMGKMRVPLKQSVNYMTKNVITGRFRAGGIPRWKAHSPVTVKIHGPHPLLILTGSLFESATGGRGSYTYYSDKSVSFGSNVEYAEIHDKPRGTYTAVTMGKSGDYVLVPGRPWTDVTQENADHIRNILMNWTRQKLTESGFKGVM